ncbi:MAG: plasmid partitioning protein RepB C-terminal domain-containing protein, partial [Hyphomicrobium sp.]
DLTFIERARFAARLEERKFSREIIMASLNVDKAALSRLIAIATRVPPQVIDAVGPAPSFGRMRWQELTDLMEAENNRARALELIGAPSFMELPTDKRFEVLAAGLREKRSRERAETWAAADGTHAAKVARSGKKLTLTFDDRVAPKFGEYVRLKLQTLYDEYKAGEPPA